MLTGAFGPIVNNNSFITRGTPVGSSGPQYLFFDNFDTGVWDNTNWTRTSTSLADISTHTSNSGIYSMNTHGGAVTVTLKAFDVSSYSNIQVGIWVRRGSSSFSERPDSNEDLIMEYLTSSSIWVNLDTFFGGGADGEIFNKTYNLTGNAIHSGFRLRFRQTAASGSNLDWWHIDDVFIKLPEDHDIAVTNIVVPEYGKLNRSTFIKATIQNQGMRNQTNITIQLKVNNVTVNSTNISSLLSFTQTNITLSWVPTSEGIFTVEIYAVPLTNENITINNWLNTTINITAQPDLWVNPNAFNLTAEIGQVATDNLTIGNDGFANLNWTMLSYVPLFKEDFEDGDYVGWDTGGSYTREVTSATAAAGTKYSYMNTGSGTYGLNTTFAPIQPTYISLYVRTATTSAFDTVFLARDIALGYLICFNSLNNGTYRLYCGSINYYYPYSINTWYHLEFKDIDWVNKNYNFYINEQLIGHEAHFLTSSLSNITRLDLSNSNFAQCWYDEILLVGIGQAPDEWLSINPFNGTIPPSNQANASVIANASQLNPGLHQKNLTILHNDLGLQPLEIPVNFTVLSAPHDLRVLNLTVPPKGDGGKLILINATILNQGTNNESNITVQLKINGMVVNSTKLSNLSSGNITNIALGWVPMSDGFFTVEIYVKNVTGENQTWNNQLNDTITIYADPDIQLSQNEFNFTAIIGESALKNLTINNLGLGTLKYKIESKKKAEVAIISDNSELDSYDIDGLVTGMELNCTVYNYNNGNWYTQDSTLVVKYDIIIWYQYNRAITATEQNTMENYLQNGGRLIVTGHDSLGSPSDSRLAALVRSSTTGDHGASSWTVTDNTHPIMNGPYGYWPKGTSLTVQQSNHDFAEADTSKGAQTIGELTTGRDKIIATELTGGGLVVYWNGNRYVDDWYIDGDTNDTDHQNMLKNMMYWMIPSNKKSPGDWLEFIPDNGTIFALNKTNITFIANASRLNPGLHKLNFTIQHNDPTKKMIIIPVNFTVLPAEHDIRVLSIEVPEVGDGGKLIPINATILNQGTSNETNITIQLKIDGVVVNSTLISNLSSGNQTTITLGWVFMHDGKYNVTIYTVNVTGESQTWNNNLTDNITITAEPDISINPLTIELTAMTGELASKTLTIRDLGLSDLTFQILYGSPGTKEVLAFTQYADMSGSGEYQNTLTAIRQVTTDFILTTFNSYTTLSTNIVGKDILLIPEQEGTNHDTMLTIGGTWKSTLNTFLDRGGTIVACDDQYHTFGVYAGAGLMSITGSSGVSDQSLSVADPTSPLVTNITFPFSAPRDSCRFTTTETCTVIKHTSTGDPVVLCKRVRNGSVIAIGFDYYRTTQVEGNKVVGNSILYFSQSLYCDWLTITPDNGTVLALNLSKVLITANASLLSPGVYYTNITVQHNDPNKSPIIIPVNFTVLRAPHDIRVLSIDVPKHGVAGRNIPINATILNQGQNDEASINISLIVDGKVVNSTKIVNLNNGEKTNITLNWKPMREDIFSVAIYAEPVAGENGTLNNLLSGTINVTAESIIWCLPESLDFVLEAGKTDTKNLTIGNSGLDNLTFELGAGTRLFDDVEAGANGWTHSALTGIAGDNWMISSLRYNSSYYSWFSGPEPGANWGDSALVSPRLHLGPNVKLTIWHYYRFYSSSPTDGGIVEINTGTGWTQITPLGGYPDVIVSGGQNPLQGKNAFARQSGIWRMVEFDLSSYSGKSVNIRFHVGWNNIDESWDEGWFIDDIRLSCSSGNISWLTLYPLTGQLTPSNSTNISVTANASILDPGVYKTNITILNNDPVEGTLLVPITLTVKLLWSVYTTKREYLNYGGAGKTVEHKITMKNNGLNDDTFNLKVSNNNWVTKIFNAAGTAEISSIFIASSASKDITIKVTIPASSKPKDFDLSTFNISSQSSGSSFDTASISTIVSFPIPWLDNFEKGILTTNWTVIGAGGAGVSSHTSKSGSYSMYMCGGIVSVFTIPFDTTSVTELEVDFWVQRGGEFSEIPDRYEDLVVEYFNKDNLWVELKTMPGNEKGGEIFDCTFKLFGDALHNDFRLRFRQLDGSGPLLDFWHIDDVYIGPPKPAYLDVSGMDLAPTTVTQGDININMAKITLNANLGDIEITSITINRTGTGSDSDISEVRLILDKDKSDDFSAGDIVLASGSFNNGMVTFTHSRTIAKNTGETFLVIYNISSMASVGESVGVKIKQDDITVGSLAIVNQFADIISKQAIILERSDILVVSPQSKAPVTAEMNQKDILLMILTLDALTGTIAIDAIDLFLFGYCEPKDVESVRLFFDRNSNGELDLQTDVLLSTKTFSELKLTFDELTVIADENTNIQLLIVLDISSTAIVDTTIGVEIDTGCINVTSPDSIQSFAPCLCGPFRIVPEKDMVPPAPPTGLKITTITHESLTLIWQANAENDVIGYNIYRSKQSNPTDWGQPISATLKGNELYVDMGLEELTTYYYVVTALDDIPNESEHSNIANGTTLQGPLPPKIKNSLPDFEIPEDSYDDSTINLFDWFMDLNDDSLLFRSEGQKHIEVIIYQENGTVILKPKKDWNGLETLIFYASDGLFEISDSVTINVTAVNDPPDTAEIISPLDGIAVREDKSESMNFIAICNDPDLPYGDMLTFEWFSNSIGKLGEGKFLKEISLPVGEHLITVEVSDLASEKSSTSINIFISPSTKPQVQEPKKPGEVGEKPKDTQTSTYILIGATIIIIILIILIPLLFIMLRRKKQRQAALLAAQAEPESEIEAYPPSISAQAPYYPLAQPQYGLYSPTADSMALSQPISTPRYVPPPDYYQPTPILSQQTMPIPQFPPGVPQPAYEPGKAPLYQPMLPPPPRETTEEFYPEYRGPEPGTSRTFDGSYYSDKIPKDLDDYEAEPYPEYAPSPQVPPEYVQVDMQYPDYYDEYPPEGYQELDELEPEEYEYPEYLEEDIEFMEDEEMPPPPEPGETVPQERVRWRGKRKELSEDEGEMGE